MNDIVFFSILIISVGFLILKRFPVYPAIFLMGISTFLYYGMDFHVLFSSLYNMVYSAESGLDSKFINLIINIYLIFVFGKLLEKSGHLEKIGHILLKLLPSRIAITVLPMVIGFFPMPGGALFTVEFVRKIGEKSGIRDEVLAFTNFWFRHVWEFVYPVYPGFILFYTILDIDELTIIRLQYPMTIAAILIGFGLLFSVISKDHSKNTFNPADLFVLLRKLWFVFVIFFTIIFSVNINGTVYSVPIWAGLLTSIIICSFIYRIKRQVILFSLKKGFNIKIFMTIYAVFFFQSIIDSSSLAANMTELVARNPISAPILTAVLPFIIGYLTGITTSYVGICFPILLPILKQDLSMAALAYSAGFAGVLVTPTHLCLSMTIEYLNTSFRKVYHMLVPATVFLFAFALLFYGFFR